MYRIFTPDGEPLIIRAIVAVSRDHYIGYGDDLIFNNKKDLQLFKEKTTGRVCVMGRKTFESIGRILPGRQTVIVTNDVTHMRRRVARMKRAEGTPKPLVTSQPIIDLPKICKDYGNLNVWICGGASIYKMFENYIATWLVTNYHCTLTEEGISLGLIPTDYDPEKLVRIDRNYQSFYSTITDTGEFNGIRYAVIAYMRGAAMARAPKQIEEEDNTPFFDYKAEKLSIAGHVLGRKYS